MSGDPIPLGPIVMIVMMAAGAPFLGVGIVVTRLALRRREAESEIEPEPESEDENDVGSGDPAVGSRGTLGGRQGSTAEERGDGGDRADRGMPAGALEGNRAAGTGQDGEDGGGLEDAAIALLLRALSGDSTRLIKQVHCPTCGASKLTPSQTAYLYCDYCGALVDYDLRIACETAGSARPGPAYEVVCEACGRIADVGRGEIACAGCGTRVLVPLGEAHLRCPTCQAELRVDGGVPLFSAS